MSEERRVQFDLRQLAGSRVRVWSGDTRDELGDGTLTGFVTVYAWTMQDGSLSSLPIAEEPPPPEFVQEMTLKGARLRSLALNPRIELDSGNVVYGCQVWWSHIGRKQIELDLTEGQG